jgi:hypothetical protein
MQNKNERISILKNWIGRTADGASKLTARYTKLTYNEKLEQNINSQYNG